jgi:hypothetical protein
MIRWSKNKKSNNLATDQIYRVKSYHIVNDITNWRFP